jgi:hypothetical protein
MDIRRIRFVGIAATVGAIAMLCAPVAQAAVCGFSCIRQVPEPATLGLLAIGLAGAVMARRRK